jgi:hypothetical protein
MQILVFQQLWAKTLMKKDFRNHLLLQIEMLRVGIPHKELSKSLGPWMERCLVRYLSRRMQGVSPQPSPEAAIREISPDCLPRQAPPPCAGFHRPGGGRQFLRSSEMLVRLVHGKLSYRKISRGKAQQLRRRQSPARAWAGSIELRWQKEARYVRNLYAGLLFFAQRLFAVQATPAEEEHRQ